jgi:hypothetical protein
MDLGELLYMSATVETRDIMKHSGPNLLVEEGLHRSATIQKLGHHRKRRVFNFDLAQLEPLTGKSCDGSEFGFVPRRPFTCSGLGGAFPAP